MRTLQSQDALIARAQRVLMCTMALGLLAFYLLAYRPQTQRLEQLQTLTLAKQQELNENQLKVSSRNEIAAKNERLRAELDQIKKPSKKRELPELIKELTMFSQQAALKQFDFKPSPGSQSDALYEIPLAVTFEGDFVNAFDFLRRTEEMQRLTRVRSMTLKSKGDRSGQVQAQVALNVYFSAE